MVLMMAHCFRWRDVKLRAFEDADHRTYVDLKVSCCLPTVLSYLKIAHTIVQKSLPLQIYT